MENLRLLQVQLALFFEDNENRPDKFVSRLMEVSDDAFNQMPIMLPIPENAPPEVPSVILNSNNGIYTCNIAKSRIDFVVNLGNDKEKNITTQLEKHISKIKPYAAIIFGYKNIIRFGLVAQYLYNTENPIKGIQSKFLKYDLGDLEELNIRYNKRMFSNNLLLNNIVELGKGTFEQNQKVYEGTVILRDFNNIPTSNTLPIEDVFSTIKMILPDLDSNSVMEILK